MISLRQDMPFYSLPFFEKSFANIDLKNHFFKSQCIGEADFFDEPENLALFSVKASIVQSPHIMKIWNRTGVKILLDFSLNQHKEPGQSWLQCCFVENKA